MLQKKISGIVKLGLVGGHRIEPLLPIHLPKNVALTTSMTCLETCGSLPSCWKIMVVAHETVWVEECKGTPFHVIFLHICEQRLPKPHHYFLDTVYELHTVLPGIYVNWHSSMFLFEKSSK
jgi:hypothetical protein